jgi:hypothetical protein
VVRHRARGLVAERAVLAHLRHVALVHCRC